MNKFEISLDSGVIVYYESSLDDASEVFRNLGNGKAYPTLMDSNGRDIAILKTKICSVRRMEKWE